MPYGIQIVAIFVIIRMQKILFFCFCFSHIQKKNGVFTGCWRNFFIFAQKNSYKTPFLKSYSFAIHDIKLYF